MRLIIVASLALLAAAGAFAAPSTKAALKIMHERHEGMEAIGTTNKILRRELSAEAPDLKAIRSAAQSMTSAAPSAMADSSVRRTCPAMAPGTFSRALVMSPWAAEVTTASWAPELNSSSLSALRTRLVSGSPNEVESIGHRFKVLGEGMGIAIKRLCRRRVPKVPLHHLHVGTCRHEQRGGGVPEVVNPQTTGHP